MASRTDDKTLIVSDLHLAHPAVRSSKRLRAAHLRPLWRGVRRLVVAGDMAELQISAARADAAREVAELQRLCEQDGVELVAISGNHDAYLTDRRHLEMCGGRVLVTHGDALHPAIAPWARGASAMREAVLGGIRRVLRERGLPDDPDRLSLTERLDIVQHVAHGQFVAHESQGKHGVSELLLRPDRVALMAWYWRNQPDLAAAFLEALAPQAEVLVFGHSHRPGVWQRGGRTIMNTGSFALPARPRAVLVEDRSLQMHRVVRLGNGDCKLCRTPAYTHHFRTARVGSEPRELPPRLRLPRAA
ncbi:MAG: metallophosphoesterase family protein [Planctomycetota bacterium]